MHKAHYTQFEKMFELFKKKKKEFTQYFAEQNPADRIYNVITDYIQPNLESNGFKMLKSELAFKKKFEKFEQEIHFTKSRHNQGNKTVRFDISFSVTSNYYSKWLKQAYGKEYADKNIAGINANYIPNWDKKVLHSISWYDLATDDNKLIVKMVNLNIKNNGFDFLNKLSDFSTAVDYLMGLERYAKTPMLMDFCEIMNDKSKSQDVLNWFEHYKKTTGTEFSKDILKNIELRKVRLKNWVQQRV